MSVAKGKLAKLADCRYRGGAVSSAIPSKADRLVSHAFRTRVSPFKNSEGYSRGLSFERNVRPSFVSFRESDWLFGKLFLSRVQKGSRARRRPVEGATYIYVMPGEKDPSLSHIAPRLFIRHYAVSYEYTWSRWWIVPRGINHLDLLTPRVKEPAYYFFLHERPSSRT